MNLNQKWSGVKIIDPSRTEIDEETEILSGTIIYPNVVIKGHSIIGKNNVIKENSILDHVLMKDNNVISQSILTDVQMESNNNIGPFAKLSEHVEIGSNNIIGNFVEIKRSVMKDHNKMKHHCYLGDAILDNYVQIGAGAITANYSLTKHKKYHTIIHSNSAIGANAVLIAPIEIGENVIVGAGSAISKDVPNNSIAIERSAVEIRPRKEDKND